MILQALLEYYERKSELGEIAPIGFEWKPIPFIIEIDQYGNLETLKDTREMESRKLVAKSFLVPKSIGRSGSNSWKTTFLLWDHWGYVLGYPKGDALKDRRKRQSILESIELHSEIIIRYRQEEKFLTQLTLKDCEILIDELSRETNQKRITVLINSLKTLQKNLCSSEKQLSTFIDSIKELPERIREEPSIQAVLNFYLNEEYKKVFEQDNWMDCAEISGANITFRIKGESDLVLSNKAIVKYQKDLALSSVSDIEKKSLCLITGKHDYIERLHSATPIMGGQATGKLVGFQKSSGFDSYNKEQAFNAPIGRYAQAAYTTALNTLIKNDRNRFFIGETTVIFWSESPNILEDNLTFVFSKPKDDPDKGVKAIKTLYESIQSGKACESGTSRFCVLGLSPNSGRISVRYWLTGQVAEFGNNIKQHFDDLEIVRSEQDVEYFALNSLLSHTALEYKLKNVAPNLAGQVTEAVLSGTPYPRPLLHSTIRRIRAEQHVTRIRAAIIKACINRVNRFYHKKKEVITVSLDKKNTNPAYLLGRLFAVLEKVQYRALKIETIRERYYGAFSSTPAVVYPQLMKLKNHHLAKMETGKNYFENLIGEIIDGLDGSGIIPRQFSLDEQGMFAVGYYHQRQDLRFKDNKKEYVNETLEENNNE